VRAGQPAAWPCRSSRVREGKGDRGLGGCLVHLGEQHSQLAQPQALVEALAREVLQFVSGAFAGVYGADDHGVGSLIWQSLLDRLINNSHQLFMNGPSYRPNKRPRTGPSGTQSKPRQPRG